MVNLQDMCQNRGYTEIRSFEEAIESDREELRPILACKNAQQDVVVFKVKKLGIDTVRKLLELEVVEGSHVILIYETDITAFSRKYLRKCKSFSYEIHPTNFFKFNPTKHVLVPEHRKLDQDERQTLLATVSPECFPKILSTDPISKWYCFSKGDVVEIRRATPLGSYMKTYRYCA